MPAGPAAPGPGEKLPALGVWKPYVVGAPNAVEPPKDVVDIGVPLGGAPKAPGPKGVRPPAGCRIDAWPGVLAGVRPGVMRPAPYGVLPPPGPMPLAFCDS